MWAVGRLSLLSRGLAIGRGLSEPKDLPAVERSVDAHAPGAFAESATEDEAPSSQDADARVVEAIVDDLDCPSPEVDGWDSRSRVADIPGEDMAEASSEVSSAVVPVIAAPEPLVQRTLTDLPPADLPRETQPPAPPTPQTPLATVSAPSFLQRVVIKVKGFFRSLFT